MRKILSIMVVAVVSIVTMLPSVAFATDDTVTGQFATAQNVPLVTVTLYDTAGTVPVTSMTPGVAYTAKVNVIDPDGLANLNTVTLKVWYDSDGGNPNGGEFNAVTAGNATSAIIYTWTESTGVFAFTEETGSTWASGASVAPSSLPGDFEFKFTVGKVATETTGSANWQIAAKVLDDDTIPNNIFSFDTDTLTNDVNFYSEINVVGTTASWGSVIPGMAFAEGAPSELNTGNIVYIANGTYNKTVKTGATWSTTATLDPAGNTASPNQFSLKADDTGTLTSAVFVTTTGTIIGSGTNTGESGLTDATNGLWLKLASTFAGGTFSGTITYTISK
jgi:hypothetical protein